MYIDHNADVETAKEWYCRNVIGSGEMAGYAFGRWAVNTPRVAGMTLSLAFRHYTAIIPHAAGSCPN